MRTRRARNTRSARKALPAGVDKKPPRAAESEGVTQDAECTVREHSAGSKKAMARCADATQHADPRAGQHGCQPHAVLTPRSMLARGCQPHAMTQYADAAC